MRHDYEYLTDSNYLKNWQQNKAIIYNYKNISYTNTIYRKNKGTTPIAHFYPKKAI